MPVGGLFIAIGHTPNTAFLNGQLELTRHGYIKTPKAWRTATSVAVCSPPATSWTTTIARRSRPRARGAWPRSKPSDGSPISGSASRQVLETAEAPVNLTQEWKAS
jgi:hypothetical protein